MIHLRARPSRLALVAFVAALLLPATALASGGGAGLGTLMAAFFTPVTLLVVIAQAIVMRVATSPVVRARTGIGTLVVAVIVALLQLYLIGGDVAEYGAGAFPTRLAWAWAVGALALAAAALWLGVRLATS